MDKNYSTARNDMVDTQLIPRYIGSAAVLDAMRSVPRHLFVPESMQSRAYDDCPLPIGYEQTISQPYIVAYMTEQLEPFRGMKVLEIGTGSGYQAAVLAYLGCDVYTIESVEALAEDVKKTFVALGYCNINAKHGNGYEGWLEEAPFDAIIVTAAPAYIPENLVAQLKEGGRMIIPVGEAGSVQYLKMITNKGTKTQTKDLLAVRFVPLVDPK